MRYQDYKTEDFLNDTEFLKWDSNADSSISEDSKRWFDKNAEISSELQLAKKITLSLKVEEEQVSEETVRLFLAELKRENNISDKTVGTESSKVVKLNHWKWTSWVAAALVVLTIGTVYYSNQKIDSTGMIADTSDEWIVKTNPRGQKLIVSLEDGSTVKLNAESTLKYSTNFRNSRIVELEGEAFFEVKIDSKHPFVVKSKNLRTTVLGTSFNVRSYPNEQKSSVVVATGKVSVADPTSEEEVFLTPNQVVQHSYKKGFEPVGLANLEVLLAWKDNMIVFENADFNKIEKELTRWFNVDFKYDKKPSIELYDGEFKNQSLENILEGIGFATGFKYRLENQRVIILN
ncbi:MAG: transmembrane sensor [Cyclobacteriaceae bacterium]|jgi:ferric-dicitrate binding protein FerR (iron transport regulator)